MSEKPDKSERSPTPISAERRRSPRVEVLERIHGQLVGLNVPLTLLNLSEGGFSTKTTFNFPIDAIHEFRFVAINYPPIVLRARVVHVLGISGGSEGDASFVAGLEFIDRGTSEVDRAIDSLINVLKMINVLVDDRKH